MKEIIIDSVDVAKCKEIANYENVLFVCHETGRQCKLNTNCYFKQLQRAKQENAKYYQQTLDDEIQINELLQTLQEIKNFLELPEFYLYGKKIIHDRIMQKITKAEEE